MDTRFQDGVEEILSTNATATGTAFDIAKAGGITVQGTVAGTGAVTATLVVEVRNDNIGWLTAGTITLSGTTSATDGFAIDARWAAIRARCTAITGTGAVATVTLGG